MRVLSVHGSPREGSFSEALLGAFLGPLRASGAAVTEIRSATALIAPCTACGACAGEARCVFDDDMTGIYGFMRDADAIVIASPLYFSSFPGPLKNLIDRAQVIWELGRRDPSAVRPKKGAAIIVAGGKYRDMFLPSTALVRHFYRTLNCDIDEKHQILVPDTDNYNAVPGALMDRARECGLSFLNYLQGGFR